MRLCLLILLLFVFNSHGFCEKLEISSKWKQSIDTKYPVIPYSLGKITDNTGKIDFGAYQRGYVDFYGVLRRSVRDINFFDKTSNNRLSLVYKVENFSADKQGSIIKVNISIRYQLIDNDEGVLFEQLVHSTGYSDAYSDDYLRAWRANTQKFMVLLRTRWDADFAPMGNQLWQAAEQEALNPNRGIDSYLTMGIGSAFKVGKGVVGGAVDVLSDPAFSAAVSQMNQDMTRQLEQQRRQEIEAKAYSARMAEERRQTTPSPSYTSSATSSYSLSSSGSSSIASSTSKTSSSFSTSTTSSGGNSNIGEINKKYQAEREKNLKAQEQKKLEQQKAYEAKLAKEQREREEEERQREIQLANEKREKERQAEKERKEREQLAQKQRVEQEKNNYLTSVKNSLRLKAVRCYGNNFAVGQMPKGLAFSKHVSGINVHYRAYCPGGGSYSGISRNFIGMGSGCFTGDTMSHDSGLIPNNVLSCKAEDMTVEVTNVTPTR